MLVGNQQLLDSTNWRLLRDLSQYLHSQLLRYLIFVKDNMMGNTISVQMEIKAPLWLASTSFRYNPDSCFTVVTLHRNVQVWIVYPDKQRMVVACLFPSSKF